MPPTFLIAFVKARGEPAARCELVPVDTNGSGKVQQTCRKKTLSGRALREIIYSQ